MRTRFDAATTQALNHKTIAAKVLNVLGTNSKQLCSDSYTSNVVKIKIH